jgi:hypothetical protein
VHAVHARLAKNHTFVVTGPKRDHAQEAVVKENLCTCGWERPLIALTTTDGTDPPWHVFPVCVCPQCGHVHTPSNIPIELAARIVADLVDEMSEKMAAAAKAVPS